MGRVGPLVVAVWGVWDLLWWHWVLRLRCCLLRFGEECVIMGVVARHVICWASSSLLFLFAFDRNSDNC